MSTQVRVASDGAAGKGGSTAQAAEINMGDLVQALTNRINPSGTKEIVIRPVRRPAGGDHHSGGGCGGGPQYQAADQHGGHARIPHRREHSRPPGHHRPGRRAGAGSGSRTPDQQERGTQSGCGGSGERGESWVLGPGREREAQGRGTRREHSAEFGHGRDDRSQVARVRFGTTSRSSRITWRATGWRTWTSWWP